MHSGSTVSILGHRAHASSQVLPNTQARRSPDPGSLEVSTSMALPPNPWGVVPNHPQWGEKCGQTWFYARHPGLNVWVQYSSIQIPSPKMTVLGGGAFWERLDHGSEDLLNQISVLKIPKNLLSPFTLWGHSWMMSSMNQKAVPTRLSQMAVWSWPLSLRNVSNKFLLLTSHPAHCMLL